MRERQAEARYREVMPESNRASFKTFGRLRGSNAFEWPSGPIGAVMIRRFKTSQILLAVLFGVGIATLGYGQRPFPGPGPRNPGKINKQARLPNPRINRNPANDATPNNNRQLRMRQQIMREIGITQDQQARIREVLRSHEDARIASNRRLREARRALDEAVMSAQFDEALIQRRAEDLAAAEVNQIKLQSKIRTEVRRVLTADQVNRFNQLEEEMRTRVREQKRREMQQDQPSARPPDESEEFDLTRLLFWSNQN